MIIIEIMLFIFLVVSLISTIVYLISKGLHPYSIMGNHGYAWYEHCCTARDLNNILRFLPKTFSQWWWEVNYAFISLFSYKQEAVARF